MLWTGLHCLPKDFPNSNIKDCNLSFLESLLFYKNLNSERWPSCLLREIFNNTKFWLTRKKSKFRRQNKKFKFKASQIPCDEAYLSYAAITTGWSATKKSDFLRSCQIFRTALIVYGQPTNFWRITQTEAILSRVNPKNSVKAVFLLGHTFQPAKLWIYAHQKLFGMLQWIFL
jgi:hypothetical protein